ncbi:MAG TPA: hypothetical protein VIT64_07880 [Ilumatobacteraceae bacterium]
MQDARTGAPAARLDLYWIPLGAGARVVRISGATYEAIASIAQRRPRRALYHSALIATIGDETTVIEMAPIPDTRGRRERGVGAEAPVGTRWAGRFRMFRYEIRRWPNGVIPDLPYAVSSPVRIADEPGAVHRVLELVPLVPTPVWGRDELGVGEMWNSNSVTSWVLTRAGLDAEAGVPPNGGRAPGWDAGVRTAHRQLGA